MPVARCELGGGGGGKRDEAWKAALPPAPAAPGTMATGSVGTMPGGAELLGLQDTSTTASATPGPGPPLPPLPKSGAGTPPTVVVSPPPPRDRHPSPPPPPPPLPRDCGKTRGRGFGGGGVFCVGRGGVALNLGKSRVSSSRPPSPGPVLSPPGFGGPPPPQIPSCPSQLFPQTPPGFSQPGLNRSVPASPQVRAPPLHPPPTPFPNPPSLPPPPPHPTLPPPPPPLIIPVIPRQPPCPNAGMCEANRARLFGAWERAEGARGPPPAAPPRGPGPRSAAIVMEIGLSPHAVELDVDSFSFWGFHISSVTCFVGKFSPELRCEIN